jgi:hypothetical protein
MEGAVATSDEVRDASVRLPERQREALELRDREQRSYEEIAASLEISPGAVAQLIAHARINLYDELRGTALASVAPSPECERALPLIAAREDGELEPASEDARWLDSHLAGCERCTLAVGQMREAELAYRAQQFGDSSGETARPAAVAGTPVPARRRRHTILAAALTGLLVLGGLAAILAGADRSAAPVEPAAVEASERGADPGKSGAAPSGDKGKSAGGKSHRAKTPDEGAGSVGEADGRQPRETASAPVAAPAQNDGGGEPSERGSDTDRPSGKAAVEPTHQTAASKPSAKPKPAAPSSPAPSSTASAPAPAPESTTPSEEPADEPGHRGEPPGKPADRPPR